MDSSLKKRRLAALEQQLQQKQQKTTAQPAGKKIKKPAAAVPDLGKTPPRALGEPDERSSGVHGPGVRQMPSRLLAE